MVDGKRLGEFVRARRQLRARRRGQRREACGHTMLPPARLDDYHEEHQREESHEGLHPGGGGDQFCDDIVEHGASIDLGDGTFRWVHR